MCVFYLSSVLLATLIFEKIIETGQLEIQLVLVRLFAGSLLSLGLEVIENLIQFGEGELAPCAVKVTGTHAICVFVSVGAHLEKGLELGFVSLFHALILPGVGSHRKARESFSAKK